MNYSWEILHVSLLRDAFPDSKVHGANMGPIWGRQDPGGPHVGPMNFAIWDGIPYCMHSGLCNQHLGGEQPQLSCQQIRFSHKSYVLWFYYGTRIFHSKIWVEYMVWSSYSYPTSHVGTKLSWRKLQSSGLMVDINTFKPRKTWNFTIFNILRPEPNGQHFKWHFRMHLCCEMNSSMNNMGLG